jgi:hypothetical protein
MSPSPFSATEILPSTMIRGISIEQAAADPGLLISNTRNEKITDKPGKGALRVKCCCDLMVHLFNLLCCHIIVKANLYSLFN